ncbi:hypothetical protein [Bacillus sp. B1-b2]|uniref:hypothetical protein n=1 Tax=Bacillus sp. B1-b2 TaxID=2653201 RepID=UPI001261B3E5|nr:hypothetical protein [Bacillus sp. B1-b2]KAB7668839.1 hypothetical protein F9279_11545 [Bacillus sp. B1-b2]
MVRVALNYAIMIEQVKQKGYKESEIINALKTQDMEFFEECGNGLPNWETLHSYYVKNEEAVRSLIAGDYEITFLTKGTLKRLLHIKYGLTEGKDFEDKGEVLVNLTLKKSKFSSLSSVLAKNWSIIIVKEDSVHVTFNIELAIKSGKR